MPGSPSNTANAQRKAQRVLKQTQALELRARGATIASIAEALRITDRYAKELIHDALEKIVVPGGEHMKKLALRRLDVLRTGLFVRFDRAADGGEAAVVSNAIVRVEERMCKLMGLDVPAQLSVALAMNPPTHDEERTVSALRENLSIDELRQLAALSAKAQDKLRLGQRAIETTATTAPVMPPVSPRPSEATIGETASEQAARRNFSQPYIPSDEPRLVEPVQACPPWPGEEDDEPRVITGIIEMPPPPQARPPTLTLREVAEQQEKLPAIEQAILFWQSQLEALPNGDNHANAVLYRQKIDDLKRQRDIATVTIMRA